MVKRVDVCTFGFLYSAGQVARPVDGPGRIPKAKSAKNERNQPGLPSVVMAAAKPSGQLIIHLKAEEVEVEGMTKRQLVSINQCRPLLFRTGK